MLWKLSEVDAAVSSLGLIAAPSGQEATPQQLAPLLPALQGLQLGQGAGAGAAAGPGAKASVSCSRTRSRSARLGTGAPGGTGSPRALHGQEGRHLTGCEGCCQKAGSQTFRHALRAAGATQVLCMTLACPGRCMGGRGRHLSDACRATVRGAGSLAVP